jgi:hypothetical protein
MANAGALQFPLFDWTPLRRPSAVRLPEAERDRVRTRIVIAIAVTWAPLVVLSLLQGVAIGQSPRDALLFDVAMYARFIVALPLLIYAPTMIDPRLRDIVRQFLNAALVRDSQKAAFLHNIASAIKARDSRLADVACLTLAYAYAVTYAVAYRTIIAPEVGASWRTLGAGSEQSFSLAGWWYVAVSQPLYLFILFRFIYRLILWWRFLWSVSWLDLKLNAMHADNVAGLGFLRLVLRPLRLPAFAIAASAAGGLANLVLWAGVKIADYRYGVAVYVVLLVATLAGPLGLFGRQIRKALRESILSEGVLVVRQLDQFEHRWQSRGHGGDSDMLSVPDFSAVTDFSSIVASAHKTKVLIGRLELLPLTIAALAPFALVAALELPIKEIFKLLAKLVM